ncbi:MAG: Pycsar system effector family protein [Erythrobacter sp.]|uniref:Pycsar system effector family protein n=1 Tax=Erythrobacter sp. TaxID=1042 RepID=UPI0032968458
MAQAEVKNVAKANDIKTAGSAEPAVATRKFSNHSIHLVRTAQTQTLSLSSMADNKASILIGATFLVFSMSITNLFGGGATWAVLTLAATAFVSSLFAVLSVIPTVPVAPKDRSKFNYLFFGHYAALETDEWIDELLDKFETDETLFRTMLTDIHQGGQVLATKKYRYLNYAYRTFLWGVFLTWIVFACENLLL